MILAFPIDTSGPYNTGVTYEDFPDAGQTCAPFQDDDLFTLVLSGPDFNPQCTNNSNGEVLFSAQSTPTYAQYLRYIDVNTGNNAFLTDFAVAYAKMVNTGYGSGGKLGTLTSIDFDTCPSNKKSSDTKASTSSDGTHYELIGLIGLLFVPIPCAMLYWYYLGGKSQNNSDSTADEFVSV